MNESAIRMEEQIISLFADRETQVYYGWILKKMRTHFLVCPLYYKLSEKNLLDIIQKCEKISAQSGRECVFRIVEHTNYSLRAVLKDIGCELRKCGIVSELSLGDYEGSFAGKKKEYCKKLFLKKKTDGENIEYVLEENDRIVGIRSQGILFLQDVDLSDSLLLEDILQFSRINGITKILLDVPEKEELPERYRRAGFGRNYTYCCYQRRII